MKKGNAMAHRVVVVCMLGMAALAARADETAIALVKAPESALVVANCSSCHSLDYVLMNSRFMKRSAWEASVHKMVTVMGAPIPPEDQKRIVDYLAREYGVPD